MHLTEMKGLQCGFNKPTSALQMGGSPPQSWLHSPPAQMPWSTQQPPLVRFTGGLYGGGMISNPTMPFNPDLCQPFNFPLSPVPGPSHTQSSGIKRKMDADETEMLNAVNKLHISETKMSAHRTGMLHALNELKSPDDDEGGPRLVLSNELKQMTAQDNILPKPLMDRMRSRNSMALVLWQPPKPRLMPNPDPDEDGNNNNNGNESLDLNVMPTFSNEPMPPRYENQEDVEMEML